MGPSAHRPPRLRGEPVDRFARSRSMRTMKRLVLAVVALVVVAVVGTFVYINVIREDAPDELTLEAEDTTDATTAAAGGAPGETAGTWKAGDGSQAGYRVDEILFGQDAEAVGRTEDVTGTLVIDGTTVETVSMEVDVTTVASDQERRDNQFKGRIMDVERYPTATFELTEPIELGTLPPVGEVVEHEATGDLTLHGTTNSVTFTLKAKRTATTIEVNGSIPVVFADYGIPSAAELPSLEVRTVDVTSPVNALGAKGIGQAGAIGSTIAVQNAVCDALAHLGVRHVDLPLTPVKVWQALQHAMMER